MHHPTTILLLTIWIVFAMTALVSLPSYERDHGRLERLETLLRAHCSEWTWAPHADHGPPHSPILTKCFPKG